MDEEISAIEGNTLVAMYSPISEPKEAVGGHLAASERDYQTPKGKIVHIEPFYVTESQIREKTKGLAYESKLNCLIEHECGKVAIDNKVYYDLHSFGDSGNSFGPLMYYRYWRSGSLWQHHCVNRLGYEDDVTNAQNQILCANDLLKEDYNLYIGRWTTRKNCYSK